MAGAGAKLFADGNILTADDLNEYLMDQTIMRFATTTARDAAFGGANEPTLAEGMFAYTDDTNTLWFYTGSAWEVATIKPSLVDAKGDLIAGTAADTVDRLAVGTNGQVLTANSAASTGLAWGRPLGLSVVYPETAVSGVMTITRDGVFTSDFTNYLLIITGTNASSGNMNMQFRVGGVTAATNYNAQFLYVSSTTISGSRTNGSTSFTVGTMGPQTNSSFTNIYGPQIAAVTAITSSNYYAGSTTTAERQEWFGNHSTATAYDGFIITVPAGTFTGNYALYGYNK